MTDLSLTIAPKSDQLNSDDLISGPRTIKITRVSGNEGTPEQPINIFFEGDGGKPYRPCKSMRRVLVHVWGRDGNSYVGRSMTIYRDPEVMFGVKKVGGTRISHMSHIDSDMTMALTATRADRKPFTVKPLKVENAPDVKAQTEAQNEARTAAKKGTDAFTAWWQANAGKRDGVRDIIAELKETCADADAPPTDDPPVSEPDVSSEAVATLVDKITSEMTAAIEASEIDEILGAWSDQIEAIRKSHPDNAAKIDALAVERRNVLA